MKAFLAAAVIVASVPVVSAIAAGPDTKATNNGDERICRVIRDRNSASRMGPRRLCMTRRQWNQSHDGALEEGMDELSTRSQSIGNYEHGVTPKGGTPR